MSPEAHEFAHSLKLCAVALISAVLTAGLVIAMGEAWFKHSSLEAGAPQAPAPPAASD